jgi:hypothetical protein
MMTQRAPSRENAGNAVRYRIAACRKRLREFRGTHQAQNLLDIDEGCSDLQTTIESNQQPVECSARDREPEKGQEAGVT